MILRNGAKGRLSVRELHGTLLATVPRCPKRVGRHGKTP
ncbi:hypothetical protein CSUI_007751, partial [Cystoisospora suis]